MTIVKVQIPLMPRGGDALLFDEGRSWVKKVPQNELPDRVRLAAQRDYKAYWHVVYAGGALIFSDQAPAQDW